ncbi:MAG: YebC/PmpR family DNA-binding transcriptional regulator [Candidatus Margulisbacteria bacterium]|nr:YebC/PmpR family DNA-binding transcriptional regulator [Candidatus Margulisiibacteriota bacterium]
MSGHSKWANIKNRKGAQDAKRGKIFTRLAKEIIISAKIGGAEVENNPRLRMAIQKAKAENMPNDNINRAIQRAVGGGAGNEIEEVMYEAYAQDGVAVIIKCATDNKNRTMPEIRTIVSKSGGNMAEKGAVSYMFTQKGLFVFEKGKATEDQILECTFDYNLEDIVTNEDGSIEVICDFESFVDVKSALDEHGLEAETSELTMISSLAVPIKKKETAEKFLNLINRVDDHEDVQNIYHNADISDEIMEQLDAEGLL